MPLSISLTRALAVVAIAATPVVASFAQTGPATPGFTIEQITSYAFPTELAAAPTGNRITWALEQRGLRNLYAAEGPAFQPRQLTSYDRDDGQELTSVQLTHDGGYVVYVRGGDHGANFPGGSPNPMSLPIAPKIQVWSVPFTGGTPKLLGDGDDPVVSPTSDAVAFIRDRAIWTVPVDGSSPARRLFTANGDASEPQWSPDGSRLAFVSNRGDHSFIGIFTNDSTPIHWLAPTTSRDRSPRWSPDGRHIVFVRLPGAGGAPDSLLAQHPVRWSIWLADVNTGDAHQLWGAPPTLRGSFPTSDGGANLHWAANDRIVFLSTVDGWPHLYSIGAMGSSGAPLLLTPGHYMAEQIRLSADGRFLVFTANAGSAPDDIDRRHIVRVPVDRAQPEVLTPGAGIETSPIVTGDAQTIAFVSATAKRPPLPAVMPFAGGRPSLLSEDRIHDFPAEQLVTPRAVVYKAPDGTEVHGQLFARTDVTGRRPALVFVHGGPQRQMLLGWHYMDYYANSYASNQYLAANGYVVLSVNYRLGVGYGNEFHHPAHAGAQGAAEYQDVLAGARWLQAQATVDPKRVGIYGGSYGGFLTALALGRNSDVFAAGVDVHGVHDFTTPASGAGRSFAAAGGGERVEEAPDLKQAREVAWKSSPDAWVSTWRSPVLLIHGDDDRNVRFSGTVDLVRRLEARHVPFEELVIVDDTHHMMRRANWVRVDSATAAFFGRTLGATRAAVGR